MLQAFFDDSGVKGTDPFFAMAGFLASAERWAEFSRQWNFCCLQNPSIRYFKMYEASNLIGQFSGWQSGARDKKIEALLGCLTAKPSPTRIFSVIDLEFHKSLEFEGPMKDPYFQGFYQALIAVCQEVVATVPSKQIEVIFDEHLIFKPRVNRWYDFTKKALANQKELKHLANALPPSPMFRDDKEFVPLQAADLIAWLQRNSAAQTLDGFAWILTIFEQSLKTSPFSQTFNRDYFLGALPLLKGIHFPKDTLREPSK